ncbi:MAG: M23 family metallopeptidase, partial [Bacteroidota bacterium]
MKFKKTLSDWLTNRYQLVIRNEEDLAEKSTFSFSYAKLISVGTILLLILVALSLALSTTILTRWLNPAYLEQRNKRELVQLAQSVDALEQQTKQQKNFIALLQSIIAGKEPPVDESPKVEEKQSKEVAIPYTEEELVTADALLRNEFENSEAALLATHHKPINVLQELFLFPAINGIVTTPFKPKMGHYGVDIVAKENEPIKCVADGVVIFAAWTVA